MVNSNANGGCKLWRNLGFAQLIQGEAFTESQLHVVSLRWWVHHRAQQTCCWAWRDGCRFLPASCQPPFLATSLVQPSSHENSVFWSTLLAIHLAEVHIRDDVVAPVAHSSKQ